MYQQPSQSGPSSVYPGSTDHQQNKSRTSRTTGPRGKQPRQRIPQLISKPSSPALDDNVKSQDTQCEVNLAYNPRTHHRKKQLPSSKNPSKALFRSSTRNADSHNGIPGYSTGRTTDRNNSKLPDKENINDNVNIYHARSTCHDVKTSKSLRTSRIPQSPKFMQALPTTPQESDCVVTVTKTNIHPAPFKEYESVNESDDDISEHNKEVVYVPIPSYRHPPRYKPSLHPQKVKNTSKKVITTDVNKLPNQVAKILQTHTHQDVSSPYQAKCDRGQRSTCTNGQLNHQEVVLSGYADNCTKRLKAQDVHASSSHISGKKQAQHGSQVYLIPPAVSSSLGPNGSHEINDQCRMREEDYGYTGGVARNLQEVAASRLESKQRVMVDSNHEARPGRAVRPNTLQPLVKETDFTGSMNSLASSNWSQNSAGSSLSTASALSRQRALREYLQDKRNQSPTSLQSETNYVYLNSSDPCSPIDEAKQYPQAIYSDPVSPYTLEGAVVSNDVKSPNDAISKGQKSKSILSLAGMKNIIKQKKKEPVMVKSNSTDGHLNSPDVISSPPGHLTDQSPESKPTLKPSSKMRRPRNQRPKTTEICLQHIPNSGENEEFETQETKPRGRRGFRGLFMKRSRTLEGGIGDVLHQIPELELASTVPKPNFRERSVDPPRKLIKPPSQGEEGRSRGTPEESRRNFAADRVTISENHQNLIRRHTVAGDLDPDQQGRLNGPSLPPGKDGKEMRLAEKQKMASQGKLGQHAVRVTPSPVPSQPIGNGHFQGHPAHVNGRGSSPSANCPDRNGHMVKSMEVGADGTFMRGGKLRSSLPIVRSPNKTLEKPLGLIFLIYGNETKRALLPNEVTSLDTVKALFCRSFQLNLQYFENASRKIYVLDQGTNLYYELEDLRDIQDRVVLKIYDKEATASTPLSPSKMAAAGQPIYATVGGAADAPIAGINTYQDPHSVNFQQQMAHAANYGTLQGSPSHNLPNQRHSVAFMPDSAAGVNSFPPAGIPQSRSYHDYNEGGSRSGSATPTGSDLETRSRMMKMENQLASLAALVQTAVITERPESARSNAESDTNSARSSISDLSSASTTRPVLTPDMITSLKRLDIRTKELKTECKTLHRMQLAFNSMMKDTITETYKKIQAVLPGIPDAENQPLRAARIEADLQKSGYQEDSAAIDQNLRDLEAAVEELRSDILTKKCRVNSSEVESMALALSNISQNLADLKGKFPLLQEKMKTVMAGEMANVVKEERFLRDEPERLEFSLKRCKKMTNNLFTMKRLGALQKNKQAAEVRMPSTTKPEDVMEDRKNVLDNIEAMVPNHQVRLDKLKEAEEMRERKKRLLQNQDALRFEKGLKLAQKNLKGTTKTAGNYEEKLETDLDLAASTEMKDAADETPVQSLLHSLAHANDSTLTENQASPREFREQDAADQQLPAPEPPKMHLEERHNTSEASSAKLTYSEEIKSKLPSNKEPANRKESSDKPHASVDKTDSAEPDSTIVMSSKPTPLITSTPANAPRAKSSVSFSSSIKSTPIAGNLRSSRGNGLSSKPSAKATSPTKVPLPKATSTPINARTVTFSALVTEIDDSVTATKSLNDVPSDEQNVKGRKIPPPPPPRRSSRPLTQSPSLQETSDQRAFSPPPSYENIEKFGRSASNGGLTHSVSLDDGQVSVDSRDGTANRNVSKPLSKFQQELASGVYVSMTKPNQQIKQNGNKDGDVSDSDSTTSSGSSGSDGQRANVRLREGKKVPPPPPVRRTSALSNYQIPTIPESCKEADSTLKPLKGILVKNKAVENGEVKVSEVVTAKSESVQSIVSKFNTGSQPGGRNYEETEIY